jgi:hypothetical protein
MIEGHTIESLLLPFHRMGQQCWLEEHRRQSHVTRIGDRWPETGNAPNGLIEGRLRPNKSEHGLRSTTARHSTSTQMQRHEPSRVTLAAFALSELKLASAGVARGFG